MNIAHKKMRFGESVSSITPNEWACGFFYMLHEIRVEMRKHERFADFYRFKKV